MALIRAREHRNRKPAILLSSNHLAASPQFQNRVENYHSHTGPNPQHDNDHAAYQHIQILPTSDEILAVNKPVYLPKKDLGTPNPLTVGLSRHLDLAFRHLRHEVVQPIKDICYTAAQIAFLHHSDTQYDIQPNVSIPYEPKTSLPQSIDAPEVLSTEPQEYVYGDIRETPNGNRFYLYHGVRVEELVANEFHAILVRISFDCPDTMRGIILASSAHFKNGMMIALLCLNKNNNKFHIYYLQAHLFQSTMSMDPRGGNGRKAAVLGALIPEASKEDLSELAQFAQNLKTGYDFCLVEFPRLMHHGFHHFLKRLQDIPSLAFTQYIAPQKLPHEITAARMERALAGNASYQRVEPPQYAEDPSFKFELGSVLDCKSGTSTSFTLEELNAESALEQLCQSRILDHGQARALQHCLSHELSFVQGPPGTGKTYLGLQLARVLLASRKTKGPILVVCLTNHALDNFLGGLHAAGVSGMVRVGSGSKEEWTKQVNLSKITRQARNSPREQSTKSFARHERIATFGSIVDGCRDASMQTLTGLISWNIVNKYVQSADPDLHQQLYLTENCVSQRFLFEHWAKGGLLPELYHDREKLHRILERELKGDKNRTPETALQEIYAKVENLEDLKDSKSAWQMSLQKRKHLIDQWKARIDPDTLIQDLVQDVTKYNDAKQKITEVTKAVHVRVLENASIIGMTTTACASRWEVLDRAKIEVILFEEAAEVMEPHTLCALWPSVQHVISIGDPLQLRPEVSDQSLRMDKSSDYRLDESLFERMVSPDDPSALRLHYEHLSLQRRMHPDIADISRLTYPFLLDHDSTKSQEPTFGLRDRLFWWDHDVPEREPTEEKKSHVNEHEVQMVTALVQYLITNSGYSSGDIAVLTPYTGQLAALHQALSSTCKVWLDERDRQKLLQEENLDLRTGHTPEKEEIVLEDMLRVTTVDNFQGEEAKVVILSTVRSGYGPGFLAISNRVTVACSRARNGFYVVGNSRTLSQVPLWRRVLGVFGPRRGFEIVTQCDKHPAHSAAIRDPKDFAAVQACGGICEEVLDCGHPCGRQCHPKSLHERNVFSSCELQCGGGTSASHTSATNSPDTPNSTTCAEPLAAAAKLFETDFLEAMTKMLVKSQDVSKSNELDEPELDKSNGSDEPGLDKSQRVENSTDASQSNGMCIPNKLAEEEGAVLINTSTHEVDAAKSVDTKPASKLEVIRPTMGLQEQQFEEAMQQHMLTLRTKPAIKPTESLIPVLDGELAVNDAPIRAESKDSNIIMEENEVELLSSYEAAVLQEVQNGSSHDANPGKPKDTQDHKLNGVQEHRMNDEPKQGLQIDEPKDFAHDESPAQSKGSLEKVSAPVETDRVDKTPNEEHFVRAMKKMMALTER